jgi:hypothetical protein
MKKIKLRLTLTEEMLGMCAQADVHERYIASKAPDKASREEEVAALGVDDVVEETRTVFPREDGQPFLWDYQVKGFFKDACGMLRRAQGTKSSKLTAHKKLIDGMIFPGPRKIMLNLPKKSRLGNCQRPLRAETAQGPRVALADSETVPEGTTMDIEVTILEAVTKKGVPSLEECLMEWFEYGQLRGLGQWRNSGKGKFTFEVLE